MNGLINKTSFFLILSVIFALAVALAVTFDPLTTENAAVPPLLDRLKNFWMHLSHLRLAAATAFSALAIFISVFSIWLWKLTIFYPWLVTHRDLTGTWFMRSAQGPFGPFTTIMHIRHGFFAIQIDLIRDISVGTSLSVSLQRAESGKPRLFVVYDSRPVERWEGSKPTLHNVEHRGCFVVDLEDETSSVRWPSAWSPTANGVLSGEYWTTKERGQDIYDQRNGRIRFKGTWGLIHASREARDLLPFTDSSVQKWLSTMPLPEIEAAPSENP